MKINKKKIGWALLEILAEVLVAIICLVIGMVVLSFFGVDFKTLDVDYDIIALIGSIIFFAVFSLAYLIVQWLKKNIKNEDK